MCLIVHNKTKNKLLGFWGEKTLDLVMSENPDGFGITVGAKNKLLTQRGFGKELFLKYLEEVESHRCDYYIHFRKATIGVIDFNNIHPFDICNDGKLYLMHNGTLPGFNVDDIKNKNCSMSDTKILSDFILNLLGDNKNQELILNKNKKLIESKLGCGRAVVISKNWSIFFNEDKWVQCDSGLIYSKKFM